MAIRGTTHGCCRLLGVAGAMGIGWLASGQPGGFGPSFEQRATPKLIAEHQSLVPGTTATLAVTFEIAPNWHMYWRGQNDTGMGPRITWSLPQGYEVGESLWPVPARKVLPGDILDHIYEDRLTILVPLHVPAAPVGAQAGTSGPDAVSIGATLRWMVCEDVCLLEDGHAAITLPVAKPTGKPDAKPSVPTRSADAPLFDDARKALPSPWSEAKGLATASLATTGGRATLTIKAPGATRLTFIPDEGCLPPMDLLRQGDAIGEELRIDFAPGGQDGQRVLGIVRIESGNKVGARAFHLNEVIVRAAEDRGAK